MASLCPPKGAKSTFSQTWEHLENKGQREANFVPEPENLLKTNPLIKTNGKPEDSQTICPTEKGLIPAERRIR
jgi:hypothetical protein